MRSNHPTEIPRYEKRLTELTDFIVGKLRFDKVQEFHKLLSDRYLLESQKEKGKGHPKASKRLSEISKIEKQTARTLSKLWKICKPYIEK
jgi:hypothetical protein